MRKALLLTSTLLALGACDLAPDWKLPEISMPEMFKEAPKETTPEAQAVTVEPATDGKWKRSDEKAQIEEFAWWRMFNDPVLNDLEEAAMKDNPTLEVAAQRVISARAIADSSAASLYPSVGLGFGPERARQSPASINANAPPGFTTANTKPYTLYTARGVISYEVDLFGKNRNLTKAAEHDAKAEQNNYLAARLALQAEVAQTYYSLAALTLEHDILRQTIRLRGDTFNLIKKKRDLGEVDDLQVSAAETDLASAEADLAVVAQQKAMQEHMLAVLTGKNPSEYAAPKATITSTPPVVPAGLPSSLLERRPDIKIAEEQIAAANARIGVARTGYFPDLSLTAVGGFTSGELSDLFKWSNRTWLIGPLAGTMLTQPVFEGGRLSAALAESKADYQGSVANYRASVLTAFREVEDQLSGLKNLADQAKASNTALKSSQHAYDIAKQRYGVGYSSYLEYLDAQRQLLAAQRGNVQVMGNRYVTTIQLVKALGGSWTQPVKKPENAVPAAPAKPAESLPPDHLPAPGAKADPVAVPAEAVAPGSNEVKIVPNPNVQASKPKAKAKKKR